VPRTANETKQSQFRLSPATLAQLDGVAAWLRDTTGLDATRSDAIRYLAREGAKKNSQKIPHLHLTT
jgi:hypothetical protein